MTAMSTVELARAERAQLCDLLDQLGPEQPTLCEGWLTRDLAAHLVIRESRPDAALGILGGPLAKWTEKVQHDAASQPYQKLVSLVRSGPPIWSTFKLPWVDGQMNTIEYFVHHEDARRGQPEWTVRDLDLELADFLWDRLTLTGRVWFAKVPGGVTLVRTDTADGEPQIHQVKGGEPMLTITGPAGELMLLAYGRKAVRLSLDGDPDAVARFQATRLTAADDPVE